MLADVKPTATGYWLGVRQRQCALMNKGGRLARIDADDFAHRNAGYAGNVIPGAVEVHGQLGADDAHLLAFEAVGAQLADDFEYGDFREVETPARLRCSR